jgi:hypothetical protein
MSVAVCCFNVLLRNMGGILHSPLRYSHEALRFLAILGKSFFPKLHICALHTRQLPALTKRLEQLGIFMQPRPDEFGPFLAESLQGCAQLRVLLHEPCEIKKRHGIRELAGIVVTRWLVCHFFPTFVLYEEEGIRTPMAESVGNVMPTNGLLRDGLLPRSSAPQRLLQFS